MTKFLKHLIEKHVNLIDSNNWRQLFIEAYDDALTTAEVIELHNMLLEADIVDSTPVRNELLFEHIKLNLDFVRDKYRLDGADPDNMTVADSYAAQFLRVYMNNTFGFSERETLDFMWDNQKALGITLEPVNRTVGQHMITNYKIHYDGLS